MAGDGKFKRKLFLQHCQMMQINVLHDNKVILVPNLSINKSRYLFYYEPKKYLILKKFHPLSYL